MGLFSSSAKGAEFKLSLRVNSNNRVLGPKY